MEILLCLWHWSGLELVMPWLTFIHQVSTATSDAESNVTVRAEYHSRSSYRTFSFAHRLQESRRPENPLRLCTLCHVDFTIRGIAAPKKIL
ncbi:hypothetical protein BDP27DRAFT_75407 [Rhodocollybia butyracea]|uniref:Secreted protein n=1 Tax=Rhodocollybia butyracea TaxID=206335 RepID=A0A9P5U4V3_9AGAR|nr:hypothetical protein BDP27DRAFT_75407 [Rhodocollybia butyracea]